MPRIKGTSNRQSAFLRAFRLHHDGPPPESWPSPAILRRWLRHDGFRRAFADMQRTLKTTLSFQSLLTGLAATQSLHDALRPHDPASTEIENHNSEITDQDGPRILNPSQRLELEREKLRHRAALTFLRLAHARLPRPPRAAARRLKLSPPPAAEVPARKMTLEEAALISKHPNCRPEVAIAFVKGEPHPDRAAYEAEEALRAREAAQRQADPTAPQPNHW